MNQSQVISFSSGKQCIVCTGTPAVSMIVRLNGEDYAAPVCAGSVCRAKANGDYEGVTSNALAGEKLLLIQYNLRSADVEKYFESAEAVNEKRNSLRPPA